MSVYDSLFVEIDNEINWIVLTDDKTMFAVIKKQLRDIQTRLDQAERSANLDRIYFSDKSGSFGAPPAPVEQVYTVGDLPISGTTADDVILDEATAPIDITTPTLVDALTEETPKRRSKK